MPGLGAGCGRVSPDEDCGLGKAAEQGGDLGQGEDLQVPADLAQGQAAAQVPVGWGIAGHCLRDQAFGVAVDQAHEPGEQPGSQEGGHGVPQDRQAQRLKGIGDPGQGCGGGQQHQGRDALRAVPGQKQAQPAAQGIAAQDDV